ncbi:MAG: DUF1573 domain-containing protein [Verrucomicrobiota bacterium]
MHRTVAAFCLTFVSLLPSVFAQTNGNPPALIRRIPGPPPNIIPSAPVPPALSALSWDATSKNYLAKPGEANAPFVFNLTNTSSAEVIINSVTTSCGCTVAELPPLPWHLVPGTNGQIKVNMNLAGKMGHVTKQVNVASSAGNLALQVSVEVAPATPAPTENARGDRNANMEMAKSDRQAVFRGDCAKCHVEKVVGKMGQELFAADCAICHDTPQRASMVPDLRAPKGPRDHNFWSSWISHGRVGSMMPGFAVSEGGPLSKEQIESLVTYLSQNFPQSPAVIPLPPALPKASGSQ